MALAAILNQLTGQEFGTVSIIREDLCFDGPQQVVDALAHYIFDSSYSSYDHTNSLSAPCGSQRP